MKLSDFFYDLPADRIAQQPLEQRDHSKLMVLSRQAQTIEHCHFFDLPNYLQSGDVLVLNETKVFPARLRGQKKSGGKVEVLLLQPQKNPKQWTALVRGATKPSELQFPEQWTATMTDRQTNGEWLLSFSNDGLEDYLDIHGEMPLPPYIRKGHAEQPDRMHYQTVFAKELGAVAAPTAGFHFTDLLIDRLKEKGVQIETITLHVGWGTFRPIRSEHVEDHPMLPEFCKVAKPTAERLTQAKKEGRRVIAVGTTVTRTLETISEKKEEQILFHPFEGQATLFIYPGYSFKALDGLITNFHLPDSTPLVLACAFYSMGRKTSKDPFSLREAYLSAIQSAYRFYSYGDAMMIL